jgi:hypothetical protein
MMAEFETVKAISKSPSAVAEVSGGWIAIGTWWSAPTYRGNWRCRHGERELAFAHSRRCTFYGEYVNVTTARFTPAGSCIARLGDIA